MQTLEEKTVSKWIGAKRYNDLTAKLNVVQ